MREYAFIIYYSMHIELELNYIDKFLDILDNFDFSCLAA